MTWYLLLLLQEIGTIAGRERIFIEAPQTKAVHTIRPHSQYMSVKVFTWIIYYPIVMPESRWWKAMNRGSQTNLASRNRFHTRVPLNFNHDFSISAELPPLDHESTYSLHRVVSSVSGNDSQESSPTLAEMNFAVSETKSTVKRG